MIIENGWGWRWDDADKATTVGKGVTAPGEGSVVRAVSIVHIAREEMDRDSARAADGGSNLGDAKSGIGGGGSIDCRGGRGRQGWKG